MIPESPYKGLTAFDDSELDALLFFGRERETEIVVANLIASRLTVLYGPSGVGKSSLLSAAVARSLRELPEEPLVVVFSRWADDPAAALSEAVGGENGSLLQSLERAQSDREVYLVLDGAEEYFLYHAAEDAPGTFAEALPAALNSPLRVNVLLSLREDSLAKLDRFAGRIPGLFGNVLRLDRLDRDAARKAVTGPVERYNELAGAGIVVEAALVERVLAEVGAGRIEPALGGQGGVELSGDGGTVEAPYLQLVMQRVWEEERSAGSDILRASTLERLGGARAVVAEHLERAVAELTPSQRDVAAGLFTHLVTPSGTKIAHRVDDLEGFAGVGREGLRLVLATLVAHRILRPDLEGTEERYEIFHDVLADPMLAWGARHRTERLLERERAEARRRQRRLLAVVLGALVALAAMTAIALYALDQRGEAQHQASVAEQERTEAEKQTSLAQAASARERKQKRIAVQAREVAESKAAAARRAEREERRAKDTAERARADAERARADAERQRANADRQRLNAEASARLERQQAAKARRAREDVEAQRRQTVEALQATKAQKRRAERSEREAIRQREIAQRAARSARRQALVSGALAVLGSDPETAASRAIRAAAMAPDAQVEDALRDALAALRTQHVLPVGGGAAMAATGSPASVAPAGGKAVVGADPAGSVVAVAAGRTVRLFDAVSGKPLRGLPHPAPVLGIAFSPDGRLLATAGEDFSARVWNVADGRQMKAYGHRGRVTSVAFSLDGTKLVTSSSDRLARVRDLATDRQIGLRHPRPVRSVAFSPDGTRVVTTSDDNLVRVFSLPDGELALSLPERGIVTAARFSPDGALIASGGRLGLGHLWDARSGAPLHELAGHEQEVLTVSFDPEGRRVLTASRDGTARVWDVASGELQSSLAGHLTPVLAAAFSPDGKRIVTSSSDGTARIWDVESGMERARLLGHRGPIASAAFVGDSNAVLTAGADGHARLWNAQIDALTAGIGSHGSPISALAIARDGSFWATAAGDRSVRLWGRKGALRALPHDADVSSVDIAQGDRPLVVTASRDGRARVFAPDGTLVRTLDHGAPLQWAAIAPGGALTATIGDDGVVKLWNGQQLVRSLPVSARRAAFSPDGGSLGTAGDDELARLFDTRTGRQLRVFEGHRDSLVSVRFSPDSSKVVTASEDHDVRVWSAATGQTTQTFSVHGAVVSDASFSSDGRWVVTAGPTKAALLRVGKSTLLDRQLTYLVGHQGRLTGAVFVPRSWRVLTTGVDGAIRRYDCRLCVPLSGLVKIGERQLAKLARERDA